MIAAMALATLIGWIAMLVALRGRVRVWVHPSVRRACGGQFARINDVAPTLRGRNRASFVVFATLILSPVVIGSVAFGLVVPQNGNGVGFLSWIILFALLFVCPVVILCLAEILFSKTKARFAQECWPAGVVAFGRIISANG